MTRRLSSKTKGLGDYPTEIPAREDYLAVLNEEGVPVAEDRLRELLGITPEQHEGFERRLAAMEREGQVLRNRRGHVLLPDRAGLIKGKVIGHADGFGFLKPEDGSADLFLDPKQMHKVLHSDVVLARVTGVDLRGRLEGAIVEVLGRRNTKVVGRLFIEQGVAFVIAENKRISQDILIQPETLNGAKAGQVVVAEDLQERPEVAVGEPAETGEAGLLHRSLLHQRRFPAAAGEPDVDRLSDAEGPAPPGRGARVPRRVPERGDVLVVAVDPGHGD